MKGRIIKGVAGQYSVAADCFGNDGIFECSAKGAFRKSGITPLVGDRVEFEIVDEIHKKGTLVKIFERSIELVRPASANIDQVLVVFAARDPEPNFNLLDRFLIMMRKQSVDTIVCFNKKDIADDERIGSIAANYEACGITVVFCSALKGDGIDRIRELLKGKTTILAGPSGVGKSSLMNLLYPSALMEVGSLSEKIRRGKQTTRHTELIKIDDEGTYLCDSPGFSSLYLSGIEAKDLKEYYPEFLNYAPFCRFLTCSHLNEPDCAVKKALESGMISRKRYENYRFLYEELDGKRKRFIKQ